MLLELEPAPLSAPLSHYDQASVPLALLPPVPWHLSPAPRSWQSLCLPANPCTHPCCPTHTASPLPAGPLEPHFRGSTRQSVHCLSCCLSPCAQALALGCEPADQPAGRPASCACTRAKAHAGTHPFHRRAIQISPRILRSTGFQAHVPARQAGRLESVQEGAHVTACRPRNPAARQPR